MCVCNCYMYPKALQCLLAARSKDIFLIRLMDFWLYHAIRKNCFCLFSDAGISERKLGKLDLKQKHLSLCKVMLQLPVCFLLRSPGVSDNKDVQVLILYCKKCTEFCLEVFEFPTALESLTKWKLSLVKSFTKESRSCLHAIEYIEQKTPLLKVERNSRQFHLSVHHSNFQEITKDIALYTGKGDENECEFVYTHPDVPIKIGEGHFKAIFSANRTRVNAYCVRTTFLPTVFVEISQKTLNLMFKIIISCIHIIIKKNLVITLCKGKSLKPQQSIEKQEQVRKLAEEFFRIEEKINSSKNVTKSDGLYKENHDKENQSEPQGLRDVIPELFQHVEIRPSEVVAFPATQQLVLGPFLNKFTSPDSAPSKHDTMAVEFLRLCTMHDYPSTNGPSLLRLAQNGFYYDGNGNELICFSCGVKIRNWKYDDSPPEIHQKASPTCRFLLDSGDGNVPVPREDIHEGKTFVFCIDLLQSITFSNLIKN